MVSHVARFIMDTRHLNRELKPNNRIQLAPVITESKSAWQNTTFPLRYYDLHVNKIQGYQCNHLGHAEIITRTTFYEFNQ